jgi:hypothetical protein
VGRREDEGKEKGREGASDKRGMDQQGTGRKRGCDEQGGSANGSHKRTTKADWQKCDEEGRGSMAGTRTPRERIDGNGQRGKSDDEGGERGNDGEGRRDGESRDGKRRRAEATEGKAPRSTGMTRRKRFERGKKEKEEGGKEEEEEEEEEGGEKEEEEEGGEKEEEEKEEKGEEEEEEEEELDFYLAQAPVFERGGWKGRKLQEKGKGKEKAERRRGNGAGGGEDGAGIGEERDVLPLAPLWQHLDR